MPLGLLPDEWSCALARRAHEVLRQKLSNGIPFSAVQYPNQIKSNPCMQTNRTNSTHAVLMSERRIGRCYDCVHGPKSNGQKTNHPSYHHHHHQHHHRSAIHRMWWGPCVEVAASGTVRPVHPHEHNTSVVCRYFNSSNSNKCSPFWWCCFHFHSFPSSKFPLVTIPLFQFQRNVNVNATSVTSFGRLCLCYIYSLACVSYVVDETKK